MIWHTWEGTGHWTWCGMAGDVATHVAACMHCLHRKVSREDRAAMISIGSRRPLELVRIDYLALDPSNGYGNVLVITDHFTKYAVTVPTQNQTAATTARVQ